MDDLGQDYEIGRERPAVDDLVDDLALDDATVDAQCRADGPVEPPADPWLARRQLGWGASEAWPLLCWAGLRDPADGPAWARARLRHPRGWNAPRLIVEKAGLVEPLRVGRPAEIGAEREIELLQQWILAARRMPSLACGVDIDTVAHRDSMPPEWVPLIDAECPTLRCSPDAWARDEWDGGLVTIELKCTVKDDVHAPMHYRAQVQHQMAVMGASRAVIVAGLGWARPWGEPGRPVVAWQVPRDEDTIRELREVAPRAWAEVERLRREAT